MQERKSSRSCSLSSLIRLQLVVFTFKLHFSGSVVFSCVISLSLNILSSRFPPLPLLDFIQQLAKYSATLLHLTADCSATVSLVQISRNAVGYQTVLINILFSFQLHSEYRSTYRWHEYTPKQAGAVVRTAPIPQQPLSSSGTSPLTQCII